VDDFARSCEQALAVDLPSGSTFLVAAPAACDWSDVRSAVAGALISLARDGTIDAALASRLTGRIEALDPTSRDGPPPEWWACDAGPARAALGFSGRSLADGARDTLASYAASGFFSPDRWPVPRARDLDMTAGLPGTGIPQETT
jgi:hypothetical protein